MGSFERKLRRNKLKKDLKEHNIKRKAPLTAYERAIKVAIAEQKEEMANRVYDEMLESFKNQK